MSDKTTPTSSDTNVAQFLAPETHQRAVEGESEMQVTEAGVSNSGGMEATYSPDDNKLRLYSVARLDASTYARVKAAGFIWAPKQGLFVAPAWTPGRADLLVELCGEIGDEDTSLVDRAEERAERFEDYQSSRTRDASAARGAVDQISKRFEFGQPILIGHHSERKARKDAERMQTGMRRAVQMWDTAQYWKERAAGALLHAQYKERADVRHRRIKTIMADKRKREKTMAEASALLKLWQQESLTHEQALELANHSYISRSFPLSEYPRALPASQYEGPMGLWSALDGGVITFEQARGFCLKSYPATIAHALRWITHYENRIAYETAMIAEQGGTAADRFDIVKGGRVLVGGEWVVVLRINKAEGKINSVSTNRRYCPVVSIEKVSDYQAPDAAQAVAVAAATKVPPIRNYPGEGFVHITQAQWDGVPKDARRTKKIAATASAGTHRVRQAMGVYVTPDEKDWNKRHAFPFVFITDAKRSEPPTIEEAGPAGNIPRPEPVMGAPRAVVAKPEPTEFDAMREQLREGVKIVVAPQLFQTSENRAAHMVDLVGHLLTPGARVLEPSAGLGRLLQALPGVSPMPGAARQTFVNASAVEVNFELAEHLRRSGLANSVTCADFLSCTVDQLGGPFDVVLMNPPFAGGVDIKHVLHACRMLKAGGCLVAICANGPRQQEVLRPLVHERGGEWEELPADEFKAEGTGVRTALLTIPAMG